MISIIFGIILLCVVFIIVYFINRRKDQQLSKVKQHKKAKLDNSISQKDIVLTKITDEGGNIDYGLLWNGIPKQTYQYKITDVLSKEEIANGTLVADTSIFKLRGIILNEGKIYAVSVCLENDIKARACAVGMVNIQFEPPNFELGTLIIDDKMITCDTSVIPTTIEIISNSKAVPLSQIELKIEPPGFIYHCDPEKEIGKKVIMIYNGENCSNILEIG